MSYTLMPTGRCFDDSMEFLCDRVRIEPGAYTRYVLIHALVDGPHNTAYAHSWVEDPGEGCVWTAGMAHGKRVYVRVADAAAYRKFMGARDITLYSIQEAQDAQMRCGHPPPWEPRYRRTCSPADDAPEQAGVV